MRYSKDHKTKTRQKIVESACRLFVSKGYAATSIAEIMRQCGLTHGGFYAHFKSKSALYHEAIGHAAAQSDSGEDDDWLEGMLDAYLQTDAATHDETAALRLAFFATDVARHESAVRAAYTNAFKAVAGRMLSRAAEPSAEDVAFALTAMIIGTAAIARTTDDPALKAKLLSSCREGARALVESRREHVFPVYYWTVAGSH